MRIPTYQRQTGAPTALPTVDLATRPLIHTAPGPDAFGAGLGRAMSQVGDQLARVAEKIQAEEDATRVVEAQNDLASWEREFFNNPETGIFSRKNKDAVGLYGEAEKEYQKKVRETTERLENDRQRQAFSQAASRSMNAKLDASARHEATQRQSWMVETAKQAMAIKLDDIAANYTDGAIVDAALGDVRTSIEAMFPGMGGEFIDSATARFVSSAHLSRIDAAIRADEPGLAQAIFSTNEDAIEGTKRAATKELIEKASMSRFLQDEGMAIFSQFGPRGEEAAAKHIRTNYEGDRENKLLSAVKSLYVDERRLQSQRESDAYDSLYDMVAGAGSYSEAINMIERSGLNARHKATIQRFADSQFGTEIRLPKSDPEALTEIQSHLDDRNLLEHYPTWKSFYAEFGDRLSFAERNKYNSMYESATAEPDPEITYNVQSGMERMLREQKSLSEEERAKIIESAWRHIEHEQKKTDRPLTDREKIGIAEGLFRQEIIGKKWFGLGSVKTEGYNIPPGYEWSEELQRQVHITEDGSVYDLNGVYLGRYGYAADE